MRTEQITVPTNEHYHRYQAATRMGCLSRSDYPRTEISVQLPRVISRAPNSLSRANELPTKFSDSVKIIAVVLD